MSNALAEVGEQESPFFVTVAFDTEERMEAFVGYMRDRFQSDYCDWLVAGEDNDISIIPSEVNVDGDPPEMLITFEYE